MEKRMLGGTGMRVSAVVYGGIVSTDDEYSFRVADRTDADWLTRLHEQAYSVLCGQLYSERERAWQEGFFSARIGHLSDIEIVLDHGLPVGAVYYKTDKNHIDLESLEVLPDRQGHGAGTSALKWLLEAGARTKKTITLKVHTGNPRAIDLYQRNGFTIITETGTHYLMQA